MTHIVERLCALAAIDNCQASLEAADAITRLRAENERLKAALEQIVRPGGADDFWQCYDIARAALDGRPAPGKEVK